MNRARQQSPGVFNPATCEWQGQEVWTAAAQTGASGSVVVTVVPEREMGSMAHERAP